MGTGGNLTSDAHLAALAIEHGAVLHSSNTDFARFQGLKWSNPVRRAEGSRTPDRNSKSRLLTRLVREDLALPSPMALTASLRTAGQSCGQENCLPECNNVVFGHYSTGQRRGQNA